MASLVARVRAIDLLKRASVVVPITNSFPYILQIKHVYPQHQQCINKRTQLKKQTPAHLAIQHRGVVSEPCLLHFSLAMGIARVDVVPFRCRVLHSAQCTKKRGSEFWKVDQK